MGKAIVSRDSPMNAVTANNMMDSHWTTARGDTAVIEITDERNVTRSISQNRLYWAWLKILSEHTGYADLEELRRLLQKKFLGMEHDFWNQARTEHITEVKGTSKLKVTEFREFLQKVEEFSINELDCTLPNTDDMYWQAMGVTD